MSKRKSTPSYHSKIRLDQRTDYKQASFNKRSAYVSRYGKCPNDFDGEFGKYLQIKGRFKRLKVFDGYIWIFSKTSNRLITIYEIPNEFKNRNEEKINEKVHV